MLGMLRRYDPDLVELTSDTGGGVLVSPGLAGRIFCRLDDELVHRLDVERLENPLPNEFSNLGGNSLWPAPEGGDFAFNYPPGSGDWYVQDGIATQPARVLDAGAEHVHIAKAIPLTNRKGVTVQIDWERRVALAGDEAWPALEDLETIAYVSEDTFAPLESYRTEQVLIAPWSLEQFPGGDGVTAFAKVHDPERAINFDFYGMPDAPPSLGPDFFVLPLGGTSKFQLGVKAACRPSLLGALDRKRGMLILRRTPPQDGLYFNIADNDQPEGPWSAADMYSVFNGGELDFFELETIAPMQTAGDRVVRSTLVSETLIARGPLDRLEQCLAANWGITL